MNHPQSAADQLALQVDRLVCGGLSEEDRRSLLAWLDEEPMRWRSCGLAFLEAQAWEQAMAGTENRDHVRASRFAFQEKPDKARSAKHRAHPTANRWGWLAIAGTMLLAFTAGTLAGLGWRSPPAGSSRQLVAQSPNLTRAHGPQLATVSIRTHLDPRLTAQVQLPVEPAAEPPSDESSIPEYVRKQWERRGYELIEETRYLPAKMPDGRTVMVPVSRVRLKQKAAPVS